MTRFAESDLLPISALQHLIYCPRQCALIHNEQQWAENRLTIEGQQLHEKAHDTKRSESRPGVRIARGLPLRSFELGLIGQADVVEFHAAPAPENLTDSSTKDNPQAVLPIEYKRGKPKKHDADKVQLCAQALCLEEMLQLNQPIPTGQLFYGKTRRRQDVPFNEQLRSLTRSTIAALRELIDAGHTPPARYEKSKCDRCSLAGLCMPHQLQPNRTAHNVFTKTLAAALGEQAMKRHLNTLFV